jgi:hypothetical protein
MYFKEYYLGRLRVDVSNRYSWGAMSSVLCHFLVLMKVKADYSF